MNMVRSRRRSQGRLSRIKRGRRRENWEGEGEGRREDTVHDINSAGYPLEKM